MGAIISAYIPIVGRFLCLGLIACALSACSGCSHVPQASGKPSTAIADTTNTALGRAVAGDLAANPGRAVFYPLPGGAEAFAVRLGLARVAERSLDVQYYMIHDDETGCVLLAELLRAAERGVRVRLLIDDIHTGGMEDLLGALDAHPHLEVRIFNPFHRRSARWMDFLFDYGRVNRRMHNKSLTADNQLTIVGGRNIGNEYFAAAPEVDFSDLDVLAAGPVVPEVSASFDQYWNSSVVFPIEALGGKPPNDETVRAQRTRLEKSIADGSDTKYMRALPDLELIRAIREKRLRVFSGSCILIADHPVKVTLPTRDKSTHATPRLIQTLGSAQSELVLISPYFVPGKEGSKWLESIAHRGVKIRILTNSMRATDIGVVHAGYSAYRERLLKAGIAIYELKPSAYDELERKQSAPRFSSSEASLHAKTYVVDRRDIFIGSLNLDPRSVLLNTEMGIVLESPSMTEKFLTQFDAQLLDLAYSVELRPSDGRMIWRSRENGTEVVHDSEPGLTWLKRMSFCIQRLLPIEKQL